MTFIPFIDESVRREYLIRDADNRGDIDEANRLREEKSTRLVARERAAMARRMAKRRKQIVGRKKPTCKQI